MPSPESPRLTLLIATALCALAMPARPDTDTASVELIVSVADQKMIVVREGGWLRKYKISTSRFGVGDTHGSYQTPLGRLRVWEKLGGELPSGSVIKHREATGEILPANAPGRDPIVSRILWLEGLEPQNERARARGIYIHGTTEESKIGKPVSWGCIRMRSEDVMEMYDLVPVGSFVTISADALPHLPKWKPAPPVIIATRTEAAPPAPLKLAANVPLKKQRSLPEPPPPVAELLRPSDTRPVPADAGAAAAFRGSILFSGLPAATAAPKPAEKIRPAPEPLRNAWTLQLAVTPPQPDAFGLAPASAEPPFGFAAPLHVPDEPLLATAADSGPRASARENRRRIIK